MKVFSCRFISTKAASGEVQISKDEIQFYHTDPKTGAITEKGHDLEGVSVAGKILVFPGGKGSSVVQADGLYKLDLENTGPKGFIVKNLDTVLVSCAVIMDIPMVTDLPESFYETVKNGDQIKIDPDKNCVIIINDK